MGPTYHYTIRTDRPRKDSSVPLVLVFSIARNKTIRLSTGKYIAKNKNFNPLIPNQNKYYWDDIAEMAIKGTPHWQLINQYITIEKGKIEQILQKYRAIDKPITLNLFDREYLKTTSSKYFHEYCMAELKERKATLSKESYRTFKSVFNKVRKFRPNLALVDVDYKFLTQFENWMLKPKNEGGAGNNKNTISNALRKVRRYINIAIKNGDFLKEAYPFKDFVIKTVDPILTTRDYLEPEEVLHLETGLSFDNPFKLLPSEINVLKKFLFACYTGLRFSDIIKLNWQEHVFVKPILNIHTKEVRFRHYVEIVMKKGDRPVMIPLIDKAVELMGERSDSLVFPPLYKGVLFFQPLC